jgi:transposase, IS30 family
MGYVHLNIDEREVILKMSAQNTSMRQIADYMERDVGTISRELSRNVDSTGEYRPHLAQKYYEKRRKESKEPYRLEDNKQLRKYVTAKLKQYWSPEQISNCINRDCEMSVSPLTIYSWIYRDCSSGGGLYKFLRRSHRHRRKRRAGADKRGQIPDRRMIDQRPRIVDERSRIGDWESDTIEGKKGSGFIITHVERKSRYTAARKVDEKSSDIVTKATIKTFKKFPKKKVKTMTLDNGREFAGFKEMEQELKMKSYFARPYHSWERGTCENTNGLLRQFFPKGMDFRTVTQSDVDRALELLNNRPRKCLNYRVSTEVFWSEPECCASD